MSSTTPIDFGSVWEEIISNFRGDPESIHGPSHWKRVEANGLQIAQENGADLALVRLFAMLHDSCRVDDSYELTHGERAARYAENLRGRLFHLDDDRFSLLHHACRRHAHGEVSTDPTIGACWDADRLDLGRVGMVPNPTFLSTEMGRRIASSLEIDGPRFNSTRRI